MTEDNCERVVDVNYIAQNAFIGVEEDIHSLLNGVSHAFDDHEELRFSHFVEVWREMKFEYIFRGRDTFRETYELTERIFSIVKDEIVSLDANLGYRAAGIYALYALYFKQLPATQAHIRITLTELKIIRKHIDIFIEGQHWDVVYCWNRLLSSHAFHFSASSRQMGIDAINSFYTKKDPSSDYVPFANPFKSQEFQSQLSDLTQIQNSYISMKKSLIGEGTHDPSLSLVNDNFEVEMGDIITNAFRKDMIEEEGSYNSEGIGNRRKELIDKYFSITGGNQRQLRDRHARPSSFAKKDQ